YHSIDVPTVLATTARTICFRRSSEASGRLLAATESDIRFTPAKTSREARTTPLIYHFLPWAGRPIWRDICHGWLPRGRGLPCRVCHNARVSGQDTAGTRRGAGNGPLRDGLVGW